MRGDAFNLFFVHSVLPDPIPWLLFQVLPSLQSFLLSFIAEHLSSLSLVYAVGGTAKWQKRMLATHLSI